MPFTAKACNLSVTDHTARLTSLSSSGMDFKCPVWSSKQEENPSITMWSKTLYIAWIVFYQMQLHFIWDHEIPQFHAVFTKCPLCNTALCKCLEKSLSDIWKTAVRNGAVYFNSAVVFKHERDGISIAFEHPTIKSRSLWQAQGSHNRGKRCSWKSSQVLKKNLKMLMHKNIMM